MRSRVAAEGEASSVFALDVNKQFLVFLAQALQHGGVDDDLDLVDFGILAHHLMQLALELDTHGHGALDFPATVAIRAGLIHGAADGFLRTLARHFHEAER